MNTTLEKPETKGKVLQKVTSEVEEKITEKEENVDDLVKKFELIPLYKVGAVINGWGCYSIGLEKILDYTLGDTSLTSIYNDLTEIHPKLLMWVGRFDGKYAGFCTTRLDNFNDKHSIGGVDKYISVIHLYIKKGTNPVAFFLALKQMKDVAKRIACNHIRMWTKREDWGGALHKRGWKKGYQEYYLEIK